jgi:hypothetical protein
MSRSQQRKGRDGELELARLLQDHGYPVEPGQAVSYGATPDLEGLPGIHIECKRVERLNVPEAMAQAERDAEKFKDGVPALFHRRNRCPWLVTMRLEDWMELYAERQWVSVKDRLPEPFVSVLGYCPDEDPLPTIHEVYMNGFGQWTSAQVYGMGNVTHWMPMPEAPES